MMRLQDSGSSTKEQACSERAWGPPSSAPSPPLRDLGVCLVAAFFCAPCPDSRHHPHQYGAHSLQGSSVSCLQADLLVHRLWA